MDSSIKPSHWNQKKQQSKHSEINEYLNNLYTIENTSIRENKLSLDAVLEVYRYVAKGNITLLRVCNKFIKEYEKKVRFGDVTKATLIKYRNIHNYITRYIKSVKKNDILIKDVTQVFCDGLKVYMLGYLSNNTYCLMRFFTK